jgi:hypothetical protein
VKAKELADYIEVYLESENPKPIYIEGPPGIGKTSIVEQVCKRTRRNLKVIRLVTTDYSDIHGIPVPENGKAVWLPPNMLAFVEKDGDRGVMFFDDFPQAPILNQDTVGQLLSEGKIGENYIKPKDWHIILAGNRIEDRAGISSRLPSQITSRVNKICLEYSLDDWKEWALKEDIHHMVLSFLNFRPGLLFGFKSDLPSDRSFSCPRTWEYTSDLLKFFNSKKREVTEEMVSGFVGEGVSKEFFAFCNIYGKIPSDVKKILSEKIVFTEKELDKSYAVLGMITEAFTKEPELVDKILEYSMVLNEEMAVTLVKDCLNINRDKIRDSKKWRKWVDKFSDVTDMRDD